MLEFDIIQSSFPSYNVRHNNITADFNTVLSMLIMFRDADRDSFWYQPSPAVAFLQSLGILNQVDDNVYTVARKDRVTEIINALSDYMDNQVKEGQ
jgi:hypothetical protein